MTRFIPDFWPVFCCHLAVYLTCLAPAGHAAVPAVLCHVGVLLIAHTVIGDF